MIPKLKNNIWLRFFIFLIWFTFYPWLIYIVITNNNWWYLLWAMIFGAVGYIMVKLLPAKNLVALIIEIIVAVFLGHLLYRFTLLGGAGHSAPYGIPGIFSDTAFMWQLAYVVGLTLVGAIINYRETAVKSH